MHRRQFITRTLQAGALLPLVGSGLFARPLKGLFLPRASFAEDRVLVLINLNGGNDGLNTVIPVDDAAYYNARPTINIKKTDALALATGLGLHPQLGLIKNLYDGGDCAVISSVGYPKQDRSHFRSTDIWHTASDSDKYLTTGWLGRYLESIHPEYPGTLPSAPFAVQISSSATLALQGNSGGMGLAIDNPDRFYNLAKGLSVPQDPVPSTLAGPELEFVRSVIEQSNQYSTKIQAAMQGGSTNVTYDTDNLSSQLKVVARMINGGLETGIYVVSLTGFDTHNGQLAVHAQRMQYLASAVKHFLDDVAAAGNADRVAMLTYSEFGRRVNENGSAGTDHGAAAPQFAFGKPVIGGLIGGAPNLTNLDSNGDIKFVNDFRQIYASTMRDWLGVSVADTNRLLGGEYTRLPIFEESRVEVADEQDAGRYGLRLDQNTPNPVSGGTIVRFATPRMGRTELTIFSSDGRIVETVLDRSLDAGDHAVPLDASALPSGSYRYVLRQGRYQLSRSMTVVK
jgi:uncharacterized protein (DUF1501 family)